MTFVPNTQRRLLPEVLLGAAGHAGAHEQAGQVAGARAGRSR
jgi:hypothetical protein